MNKTNLLTSHASPFVPFGDFLVGDLELALQEVLEECKLVVQQIESIKNPSWATVANPLYSALYKLNNVWGIVHHLLSINDTSELRELELKYQPLISTFYLNLGQNQALYDLFKTIKQQEYNTLTKVEKVVTDNEFRDFFLSGFEIETEEDKEKFKAIQIELDQLSTKFEQNVLDTIDGFAKYVDLEDLQGVPADIISMYKDEALKDGKADSYKLTLQIPSYLPIMKYASNRALREEMYYKYVTMASELGDSKLDNSQIINRILKLRYEKAKLLNFNNYAELSLYTKMANNPKEVLDFLYDLARRAKPQALKEIEELKEFAYNLDKIEHLQSFDILYYSEKLQQQKYSYSTYEVKEYFQVHQVLTGLFNLINTLYKINFNKITSIPTWHEDVLTYEVVGQNQEVIGYFYLDLFARNSKQSGAWMKNALDRFTDKHTNHEFKPIAYIICNFTPSPDKSKSLLEFDDVQTLFHEMGHALHHLVTQVTHFTVSGVNNVEWDAVELPSQFMEYFTWDYQVLKDISSHIVTQNKISDELYNKILSSRFFQTGLATLRQVEFALFDIQLHIRTYEEDSNQFNYLELLNNIRQEVAVIFPPHYNRFPNSFSHIFGGGYASGYYSYKWAELLACDVFSRFDENKNAYSEIGHEFYNKVLTQGGVNPMLENFQAFMGRAPKIDALLKYSGIKQ